jgi:integrase
MIQVSLRLGLRSGEIRALLWGDVDYDEMTIRIDGSMQKGEDHKLIPIRYEHTTWIASRRYGYLVSDCSVRAS